MKQDNFYKYFPTAEEVAKFEEHCKYEDEQYRKNADYRMQNYYNCVDDYSWGGICDQIADRAKRERDADLSLLKEQLKLGKAISDQQHCSILVDAETKQIVSERIVKGKFGDCWIIKNGNDVKFVSVAKKQSTYQKKGYLVFAKHYHFEYYGYFSKGVKIQLRILKTEILEELPEYQSTYLSQDLYFAIKNKEHVMQDQIPA